MAKHERFVGFREPTPEDVSNVANNLREADRTEILSAFGPCDVAALVTNSVMRSDLIWAGHFYDDQPAAALFGVTPVSLLGGVGSPWMVGTDEMFRYPGALVALSKRYIQKMAEAYPKLVNYVDERNLRSVRWLKRMGFAVEPAKPYGFYGRPFHRFSMEA